MLPQRSLRKPWLRPALILLALATIAVTEDIHPQSCSPETEETCEADSSRVLDSSATDSRLIPTDEHDASNGDEGEDGGGTEESVDGDENVGFLTNEMRRRQQLKTSVPWLITQALPTLQNTANGELPVPPRTPDSAALQCTFQVYSPTPILPNTSAVPQFFVARNFEIR
jgi:hypothetical protein